VDSINSWLGNIWSVILPFKPVDSGSYGQLGDWIGGVGGTIITLFSLIALILTLRLSRAAMTRQGVYAILSAMSKTHDDLTASFRMSDVQGSEVFKPLLSDFHRCVRATQNHYPELNVRECIDVAYTLFFYGPTITGQRSIASRYDASKVRLIFDEVSKLRDGLIARYPDVKDHRLSGNQARLSNYYRNLYAIYTFIDESGLPLKEKKSILKTIRTKMNNHEQALLALNICSHLGSAWERHELLERYEPIKNIPYAFLSLPSGVTIDELFPEIKFEFEDRQQSRSLIFQLEFYGLSIAVKIKRRTWHYNLKKMIIEKKAWSAVRR
jgi:hypothetical protein